MNYVVAVSNLNKEIHIIHKHNDRLRIHYELKPHLFHLKPKRKIEALKFCIYTYTKWIGTTRSALGIEDYFGALLLFRGILLARNRFYSPHRPDKICFPILPLRGSVAQAAIPKDR